MNWTTTNTLERDYFMNNYTIWQEDSMLGAQWTGLGCSGKQKLYLVTNCSTSHDPPKCWFPKIYVAGQHPGDPWRHYQCHIPVALLNVPAGEFPELRLKAWTSRVLTAFLSVCLQDLCSRFANGVRPPRLALAAGSCAKLSEWMLKCERTPRYMTQTQADELQAVAWEFAGLIYLWFFILRSLLVLTVLA